MPSIAWLLAASLVASAHDPEALVYPEDTYRLVLESDMTWVERAVPSPPERVSNTQCLVRVFVDETGAAVDVGWQRCGDRRVQDVVEPAVLASRWRPHLVDGVATEVQFQVLYRTE